jgi:hypothetical protein
MHHVNICSVKKKPTSVLRIGPVILGTFAANPYMQNFRLSVTLPLRLGQVFAGQADHQRTNRPHSQTY